MIDHDEHGAGAARPPFAGTPPGLKIVLDRPFYLRQNLVPPSGSITRAAARGISVAELQAEQEAAIPIRRANRPEDIAAMAVFLASPGACNITGQSYNVDGGLVPS